MLPQDRFAGVTSVVPLDLEWVLESHLRNIDRKDDVRNFKYEDSIIRPRHIIMLSDMIKRVDKGNVFMMTAPVGHIDGKQIEVQSHAADTFEDLLSYVEDKIVFNKCVALYSIFRVFVIDPLTFDSKTIFKIRLANLA